MEWNIGIVGVTPIHEGVDKDSATQEYSRQENTICHIQGWLSHFKLKQNLKQKFCLSYTQSVWGHWKGCLSNWDLFLFSKQTSYSIKKGEVHSKMVLFFLFADRKIIRRYYKLLTKISTSKGLSNPMKLSSKVAWNSRSGGRHLGELLAAWWQVLDIDALNLSLASVHRCCFIFLFIFPTPTLLRWWSTYPPRFFYHTLSMGFEVKIEDLWTGYLSLADRLNHSTFLFSSFWIVFFCGHGFLCSFKKKMAAPSSWISGFFI